MIGDFKGCHYLSYMPKIEIKNISKSYGRNKIIKDLSAVFDFGIYGISGPNGSGKSTLMKCLAGLHLPDKGTIEWNLQDRNLENKELYKHLGFSAPYIQFYRDMSCVENLNLITELLGQEVNVESVRSVLEDVGLIEKSEDWYGNLSSGQQQRLRIAGSLIKDPDFLLFDEPGTNLDSKGYKIVERVVQTAAANGKIVIIASNDPEELALCSEILSVI